MRRWSSRSEALARSAALLLAVGCTLPGRLRVRDAISGDPQDDAATDVSEVADEFVNDTTDARLDVVDAVDTAGDRTDIGIDRLEAGSDATDAAIDRFDASDDRFDASGDSADTVLPDASDVLYRPDAVDPRCAPGFVFVPAGTYPIGAPATDLDAWADEQPAWMATLSAFCISRTEVTAAQYGACVTASRCGLPSTTPGSACNYGRSGRSEYPVNCVAWNNAVEYCAFAAGRLPTEAQWEASAHGLTWRAYGWGSAAPTADQARFGASIEPFTDPTSMTAARCMNPFGLCDMSGNVWEWVADYYHENYPSGTVVNPTGPASGTYRVLRGGGCTDRGDRIRTTARGFAAPGGANANWGFRCVRDPM